MYLLKKYVLFLCVTGFFISTNLMVAQYYNTDVVGKIKIDNHTDFLDIMGTATNKSEINQSLRYELSVIKTAGGNNSKNTQNGRFTLEPSELKELSKTSINLEEKDKIIILLLIYDLDDKLVGKDRYLVENKEVKQDNQKQITAKSNDVEEKDEPEDGITLRGIVTEETKTKAGSDFFKYFYSYYMNNKINSEEVVVINETFNFGRNTRIEVKVSGSTVFQFFVQPKDDYLRTMADISLKRVSRYLEQQKRNTASIQKY